ncbi:MAG: hypothetical protein Crog4KO_12350 [Crocinitomicaceae bacterium]
MTLSSVTPTKPKHVSIFAILVVLLVGCAQDSEEKETKAQQLQKVMENHQWEISAINSSIPLDFNGNGEKSKDIKSQNAPCQADDQFIFQKKGALVLEDGSIKCPDREGKSNKGAWTVDDNHLTLKLPNAAPVAFKIVSFQEQEIKVSKASPISRDAKTVLTYTFTRVD